MIDRFKEARRLADADNARDPEPPGSCPHGPPFRDYHDCDECLDAAEAHVERCNARRWLRFWLACLALCFDLAAQKS